MPLTARNHFPLTLVLLLDETHLKKLSHHVLSEVIKCKDWWPLNFNASGTALTQPPLAHMGYASLIDGVIGQFGKDDGSMYTLCGAAGHSKDDSVTTISRRRSKQSREAAKSLHGFVLPAKSTSPAPMFPNLIGFQGSSSPLSV